MRDHLAGLDATHVSYSELNTLAQCEERWRNNYLLRREGPPSAAMKFGTVIHKLVEDWWTEPWDPWSAARPAWWAAEAEQVVLEAEGRYSLSDADWLFARYMEFWAPRRDEGWHRADWCTGELSLEADIELESGKRITVRVTPDDFLVDPTGALVLVERKTMASWQRLELVDVTPQETVQAWAARENQLEIDRILFDAIKSYRWALHKPTQGVLIAEAEMREPHPWNPPFGDNPPEWAGRPLASRKREWARAAVAAHPGVEKHGITDSFQAIEVYRDDEQIDGVLGWVRSILERREALLAGAKPIRNIGNGCRTCPYQDECWTDLSFPPQTFEIDDEEDD